MGIYDSIESFHTGNIFANENFTGKLVEFAPAGDWNNTSIVPAEVIGEGLPGSNEVRGDGVRLESRDGRTVRDSITVEFRSAVNVQRVQSRAKPDMIKWDDVVWVAVRTIGFDENMKSVRFVRTKDVLTGRQSRRG